MVTHTPGPWAIEHEESAGVVIHAKRGGLVATAPYTGDAELTRANAHLISAAPEMLAVLKEYAQLDTVGFMVTGLSQRREAAIAKAEGK